MQESKIKELVEALCKKEVSYKFYDGTTSLTSLIQKDNKGTLESIIREYAHDSSDDLIIELKSKIGTLEAKVFTYEQIISKSNFNVFVDKSNDN